MKLYAIAVFDLKMEIENDNIFSDLGGDPS
jgi:hypothetical protein